MLFYQETSIGKIGIEENGGYITSVYLPDSAPHDDGILGETPLIGQAFKQLELYLDGQLTVFTLPLKPEGTDFMKKVWRQLLEVPYGQTASYKDIAVAIGCPKAVRAVGMANSRNPIPIFIPCHRIIGSNGELVGYGGGLPLKKKLIDLEKQSVIQ